ncbi:tellurite resistance TerB family protein [Halomonas dongshanensis]|uniref:Tellurite resistance TerB family protein n=1 Tax=Halomonas dongshanensis TaxID=2890835 RepID=A0ABT2EDF9_9GAMM|nr:tellurite resistance TerB family protein [Halomonas dongshanensis]MCS2609631.1 tellurite resistance TerB family protein [Halomonas dongshanensis]
MNASKILQQLMQQAGGKSQGGKPGGVDVKGMLSGLSRQLGGGAGGGSSSGGVDMKSLLGGGALGMLVGSSRGRKLGGKALKYGAIAGVGMLAWKAWQNAQDKKGMADGATSAAGPEEAAAEGERVDVLEGEYQERRSLELLQAMIMAARADGHIDAAERELIAQQIDALGADDELHRWVEQQLNAPLDANALAQQADSPQAAREMYLISLAVIDEENPMERAWLDQLAGALKIPRDVAGELEHQARHAD